MLNIEQELEVSDERFVLVGVTVDGDEINALVHYSHDSPSSSFTLKFDRKTGVYTKHLCRDERMRLRPKSESAPQPRFDIHVGQKTWGKSDWVVAEADIESVERARELVDQYNVKAQETDSPFRFMMKRRMAEVPVHNFTAWGEFRIETGEWQKVPWADEPWASKHAHHFAHNSVATDGYVAFWATPEDAMRERITTMRPGRYLETYFSDILSAIEIRAWALRIDDGLELRFARTPDEIYAVYTHPNSPESCMRYKDHQACYDGHVWYSGINPVRIYGAGDLAVAYLERSNKIIARGLVWPEKKVYGRIYGDSERLIDKLVAEGYRADAFGNSADSQPRDLPLFDGARLLRIDVHNDVTMPYLDLGYQADYHPTEPEKYLVMSFNGSINGQTTCGTAEGRREDTFECDHCGGDYDEDDRFTVNGCAYCYECYRDHTQSCDNCHDRFHCNDMNYVSGDDADYCDTCFHNLNVNSCDGCNEQFRSSNLESAADTGSDFCSICAADMTRNEAGELLEYAPETEDEEEAA